MGQHEMKKKTIFIPETRLVATTATNALAIYVIFSGLRSVDKTKKPIGILST
jgi:hypothetical protein